LPADLAWAVPAPAIAGAFARCAAVVERIGEATLSPHVRALIGDQVLAWHGDDPGLSRHWVEKAVRGLDGAAQDAARLALLAALAPHQIDASAIAAFRTWWPADSALIGALAWASFTAARRIGTWLDVRDYHSLAAGESSPTRYPTLA
jgi:hypothetical protein